MGYGINDLLELTVDQGASELHLQVGQPPTLKLAGSMMPVEGSPLPTADAEAMLMSIASESDREKVKATGGAEFEYTFRDRAWFRVTVLKSEGKFEIVLRLTSSRAEVMSLTQKTDTGKKSKWMIGFLIIIIVGIILIYSFYG